MAISLVYAPGWVNGSGATDTWTPSIGTEGVDWTPGDLCIAIWGEHGASASLFADETGWTALDRQELNIGSGTSYLTNRIWYRFLQTGDTNPTFGKTTAAGGGGGGFVTIWRGVDTSTPLDGVTPVQDQHATATITATSPSVTSATNNAVALRFFQVDSNTQTTDAWAVNAADGTGSIGTKASGGAETSGSDQGMVLYYHTKATAGAVGTATIDYDGSGTRWNKTTFVLKPSAAGAPVPGTGYTRTALTEAEGDMSTAAAAWIGAVGTVQFGDYIDWKATSGACTGMIGTGEVSWSTSSGTLSWYHWDASLASYSAEQTTTFGVAAFSGLVQDLFTGTNGTSLDLHSPDTGTAWTLTTVAAPSSSGTPAGNVKIESNRLSCGASRVGAEIDAGETDVDLRFDWIIPTGNTAASFHAHARRANTSNYVGMVADQADGYVRLVRRTAGVSGTIGQAAVAFAAGTYQIRMVMTQNALSVYVNGALQLSGTYAGNQGASDTKVALFSGAGDLPTIFDNFETYSTAAALPQQVSVSTTDLECGETFSYILSPADDEEPDELKLDGLDLSVDGAGLAGDTSVAIPTVSDFLTGAWNGVPWHTDVTLSVGFPTNDSVTTTVQIVGPAGRNVEGSTYWTGTFVSDPQGPLEGGVEEEQYLLIVRRGKIVSIDSEDYSILASEAGTAEYWRFTSDAWTFDSEIAFPKTTADWDYPGGRSRFDDDGMLAADDAAVIQFVTKFVNEVIA